MKVGSELSCCSIIFSIIALIDKYVSLVSLDNLVSLANLVSFVSLVSLAIAGGLL